MIRLIAADLDGTLLFPDSSLYSGIFSMIRDCRRRNIAFVIASGRDPKDLCRIFSEVLEEIFFVAQNGTCYFMNGCWNQVSSVPEAISLETLELLKECQKVYPVVDTLDCSYVDARGIEFFDWPPASLYVHIEDDLSEVVKREQILRFRIYGKEHTYPFEIEQSKKAYKGSCSCN